MDPANVLFVIAFIGLPIAFGIWAIVSRRELKRARPPVARPRPAPPVEAETDPPPAKPRRRRRQLRPRQQPAQAQPTAPYQAVQQQPTEQPTMQAPAVQPSPEPPPSEPAPAAQPPPEPPPAEVAPAAPVDYGPSGTTQEFPVIADGMMPRVEQEQETMSIPIQIPEEQLVDNTEPPSPAVHPDPAPVPTMPPEPPAYGPPVRRRYFPVQYVGRSKGVVRRMTPLAQRQFVHHARVRSGQS